MFENLIARIIGTRIAKAANLQEDAQMETKPWYQSKTMWTAVIAALVGVYQAIGTIHPLPAIPDWIYSLLGAAGLVGLRTANTLLTTGSNPQKS